MSPAADGRPRVFETAPYPVAQYAALRNPDGRLYLDARRFRTLQDYVDGARPNLPRSFPVRGPAAPWATRWQHTGGRMAGGEHGLCEGILDQPYVRCFEEVAYVRGLLALLQRVLRGGLPAVCELFVWAGRVEFHPAMHRGHWAKEFYDENRIRDRYFAFSGWQSIEFHNLTYDDRRLLYWQTGDMPTWRERFESDRILGVPNPPVTIYAADLFYQSAERSPVRVALSRVFRIEQAWVFLMSFIVACTEGIVYNEAEDQRHNQSFSPVVGRIFPIPDGVLESLSVYHPFYFLESSGVDPIRGFLALRRAQEWAWGDAVCAPYHFGSSLLDNLAAAEFTKDDETHRFPAVIPEPQGGGVTTLETAQAAWSRFRELTVGHAGRTQRVQLSEVVTAVLNAEGFGVESRDREVHRLGLARSAAYRWTASGLDSDYQADLDALKVRVAAMPAVQADGGMSRLPRGRPWHPAALGFDRPPEAVPPLVNDEANLVVVRPRWWPLSVGLEDMVESFVNFRDRVVAASFDEPVDLQAGLALGGDLAEQARGLLSQAEENETQLVELRRVASAQLDALERLRVTNRTAQANAASSLEEVAKAREERDRLQAEQDTINTQMAGLMELESALQEENTNLRGGRRLPVPRLAVNELTRLRDLVGELSSDKDTLETALKTAQEELVVVQSEVVEETQRGDTRVASVQQRLAGVTTENRTLRERVSELEGRLEGMAETAEQTEALQEEISTLREESSAEVTRLHQELGRARAGSPNEIVRLRGELETVETDLREARAAARSASDDHQLRIDAIRASSDAEASRLRTQVESAQAAVAEVARLRQSLGELRTTSASEKAELQQQLDAARAGGSSADADRLRGELETVRAESATRVADLERQLVQVREDLAAAEVTISRLSTGSKELISAEDLARLRRDLQRAHAAEQRLRLQVANMETAEATISRARHSMTGQFRRLVADMEGELHRQQGAQFAKIMDDIRKLGSEADEAGSGSKRSRTE